MTGQSPDEIDPAEAYSVWLAQLPEDEFRLAMRPRVTLDPDNPVATDDEWLAREEAELHAEIERDMAAQLEG